MQLFETVVIKLTRGFDYIAGIILAATVFLVVANILGRIFFQQSFIVAHEVVGYLTAAVIGLALARCALENGHIAIDFILERFEYRIQRIIDFLVGIPVFPFLLFIAFNLFTYGSRIAESGEVSPTAQLIFYPFIYLVAIGFFMLAMVALLKILKLFAGGDK
ncbi:MAG: TRAP transporter small permease [Bacillota bacterium]